MNKATPALEYGFQLGRLKRGLQEMFCQIEEGFKLGMAPVRTLTEDQLEIRKEVAFQRQIARERDAGLAFVRQVARKVHRENGCCDGQR